MPWEKIRDTAAFKLPISSNYSFCLGICFSKALGVISIINLTAIVVQHGQLAAEIVELHRQRGSRLHRSW